MAEVFTFDPTTEFEIIENLDFEEEVQRPEELRFFTLDEQLLDYFQKVLPKKKKISKFEYLRIANEVDRIRELYGKKILVTDTEYKIDTRQKQYNINWIQPIYSQFSYEPFSFAEKWSPLYEPANRSVPNYYPRMLIALPKPYKTTSQEGVPLKYTESLVNETGEKEIKGLSIYNRTKGVVHEDGSFTVEKIPVLNTEDDLRIKGYFLRKRELDIPNPLNDHPFFGKNEESPLFTTEVFEDIFPSVEAIMSHGVPQTTDPYKEGLSYMKLYDVSLSSVPYSSWKTNFPPVDTILEPPSVISISFPKADRDPQPAKQLQDVYSVKWASGISPRLWLMMQEDGGVLVSKMILSKASESGLLPPEVIPDKATPVFENSTPDECFTYETFERFLEAGVFRFKTFKKNEKDPYPNGLCVPVSYIAHERADILKAGKVSWRESTEIDVIREQISILKKFQKSSPKEKETVYEIYQGKVDSQLRREIRAVLNDGSRTEGDKLDGIQILLKGVTPLNNIYSDKDGSFLLCNHSNAILNGDLMQDRLGFYAKWTAIIDGHRSCIFCGEDITNDVLEAQNDFDEFGNVIISHESLDSDIFHGESHVASFTNSLKQLQSIFLMENTGEACLYLILSILQILPEEGQLIPILQNIRGLTSALKANKKISQKEKDKIEGMVGIAGSVILLQTHNPFLIPRVSFGSKVLKLSGYPRDTENDNEFGVLDTILFVMKSRFEEIPTSLKGPVSVVIRAILSNPKKVRSETNRFIGQAVEKFKTQLQTAKERYTEPVQDEVQNNLNLPFIPVPKTSFSPDEKLSKEEKLSDCNIDQPTIRFTSQYLPSLVQEKVEFWKNIKPSKYATQVELPDVEIEMVKIDAKSVRSNLGLSVPKGLEKIDDFLKSDQDSNGIFGVLNRILDITGLQKPDYRDIVDYHESSSLKRDYAKGLLLKLLSEIKNDQPILKKIKNAIQNDLTLRMLLTKKDLAEREELELQAKERETLKARLRAMNDTQREVTKLLLDIGIAPFIITNEDREMFKKEYKSPDLNVAEEEFDEDLPEEGPNATREKDDDDDRRAPDGTVLETDYGDYGDVHERDWNDYSTTMQMPDED
jgi:hypothetical protein